FGLHQQVIAGGVTGFDIEGQPHAADEYLEVDSAITATANGSNLLVPKAVLVGERHFATHAADLPRQRRTVVIGVAHVSVQVNARLRNELDFLFAHHRYCSKPAYPTQSN